MYEIYDLGERCHYVECPSRIGIINTVEGKVSFIDSGNDKSAAKKALKAISERGWQLESVYCTHSHADHIGGCKYLCEETGCKIYAPGVEAAMTRYTYLEPTLLYGGYPMQALRGKFMIADPSPALPLTDEALPTGIHRIALPGHTPEMTGYITDDGVAFIGDAIAPESTLNKYGIFYLYDVGAYLESLDTLEKLDCRVYLPSHSSPISDISGIVNYNRQKISEICDKIVGICDTGMGFDDILSKVLSEYGLNMTVEQYALIGSTLRSYLSYLTDGGKLKIIIDQNTLKWQKS